MSKELNIIAGKHMCGRVMLMRLNSVTEDDKNPNAKVIGWLIHGVCKYCEVIIVSKFFHQEEEPIQGVDFIIDNNMIAKVSKVQK